MHSFSAARLAAGCVIELVFKVATGELKVGLVLIIFWLSFLHVIVTGLILFSCHIANNFYNISKLRVCKNIQRAEIQEL